MEYSNIDTHLDFSTDNGATYKELYGLSSYPDMGASPARIDVSNMRDKIKRAIDGQQDIGELTFDFYYNNESTEDGEVIKKAFSALKAQEGKLLAWKLCYPDETYYSWKGKPSVFMKGGGVSDPMRFTLSVTLETELEYKES